MYRRTNLKDIPLWRGFPGLLALEHLLQNLGFLLHLGNFLRRFGPIISLVPIVVSRHDLHQPVRFL